MPDDSIITEAEAARMLGLSSDALKVRRWRNPASVPPHFRFSLRCIRYRAGDVRKWLEAHRAVPVTA